MNTTGYCGLGMVPDSCGGIDTEVEQSGADNPRVWKVYAVFPDSASPRLKGLTFGIHYSPTDLTLLAYGACIGDLNNGAAEFPGALWPGTDTGISLVFQEVQTGGLVECYWFAGYSSSGAPSLFALRDHPDPNLGGQFGDDAVPANLDDIAGYGVLGFGSAGYSSCATSRPVNGGDGPDGLTWNPCDDRVDPPYGIPYKVLVLDATTHAPLSGIKIRVTQIRTRQYFCGPEFTCTGVPYYNYPQYSQLVSTGSDGVAGTCFDDIVDCYPYGECYALEWHSGFQPPELPESPAAGEYQDRIMAYWTQGTGDINHVVYVTGEAELANRFAPVLHGHRYELQEGLADIQASVDDHASLLGEDLQRPFYPWQDIPPLEAYDCDLDYCSFARQENEYKFWVMNFDDSAIHEGAPVGYRPLYYHVFPYDDGAVIQYWTWYMANDIREQTDPDVFHEGDWEGVAVKIGYTNGRWDPQYVNFYRHSGGITVLPSNCWWSGDNTPTYLGIRQGYSPTTTHLHVWVSANSHGTYNRYQSIYSVQTGFSAPYYDHPDYGIAGDTFGAHRFLAYDLLVPTGEFEAKVCET